MTRPLSPPQHIAMGARRAVPLAAAIAAGVVAAAALAGALVLWVRYGTAVFFEMLAAGLQACF